MAGPEPTLIDRLTRAREETLRLIRLIEDADLNRSLNPEFSPIRWHLGHIAHYEATWVLVEAGGQPSPNATFDRLFDPTRNPKAERIHLPPRSELVDYGRAVRDRVRDVLRSCSPDHPSPLLRDGLVGELVYEHECQHQEIISFLLQMIPPERKQRPDGPPPLVAGTEPANDMAAIPEGTFTLGAAGPGFAYDNEREPHPVHLPAYRIDRAPVTEWAFARFIDDGGYRAESLWTPEGWRWRTEGDIAAPRDWSHHPADGWRVRTMFEVRPPGPGVPVIGVSAHEAEAYARWRGARLPSEAEWERAAAWDASSGRSRRFPWGDRSPDPSLANTDGQAWGTRPVGAAGRSPNGCDDMAGQVWEWTASPFAPYPGFRAFPYEGYSQAWFDGEHRVLRGGSWATRGPLCRASFRNWYHPFVREMFAGFRCAADA